MFLKFRCVTFALFAAVLFFALATVTPDAPAAAPTRASSAAAQGKGVRTTVTSESMIYDSDGGKVTFSKSVHVNHPDFVLDSNKLDLYLAKSDDATKTSGTVGAMDAGKVERVVALENVRIKLPQGRSATCAKGTYTVRTEILKMEGSPVLYEDGNRLSADIIYFYFKENRSNAEGNVKVDFVSKESSSPAGAKAGAGGGSAPAQIGTSSGAGTSAQIGTPGQAAPSGREVQAASAGRASVTQPQSAGN